MLKVFTRKKAAGTPSLESVLGSYELPSFPGVILAALDKVRDERTELSAIADVVSNDPAVTVKLLGTINSAAYGLRHRVRSVHHAISLLGRAQVESILIGMAVHGSLPRTASPGFDATRFWKTAARRAVAARAFADRLDPSIRSECFTGALLADMAIPVLAHGKGAEYGAVLESWHAGQGELDELEEERFGWTHAGVAGTMCRSWQFPELVTEAIAGHHDRTFDADAALVPVRLVAPLREVDEERGVSAVQQAACEHFRLDAEDVAGLLADAFEEAASLESLVG